MHESIQIREAEHSDWPNIWNIIEPVFRAGETYAFPREISELEARAIWCEQASRTFVAEAPAQFELSIVGTYYIKPNTVASEPEVCNCGYIVSPNARGKGVASTMCEHSQKTALELGFKSMQYNFVISSNKGAIRLWKKLGFEIRETLDRAFNHPALGPIDAFVMYKQLDRVI